MRLASIALLCVSAYAQSAVPVGPVTTPTVSGNILLPNPKALSLQVAAVASGNVDIYTVPANRAAIFYGVNIYDNACGSTPSVYAAIKISSTYYALTAPVAPTANTGTTIDLLGFIAVAGQKLAINSSVASCVTVTPMVVEFDAGSALKTAYLTSLSAGNNTIYTAPAGKSAMMFISTGSTSNSGIFYTNNTGSDRTLFINVVLSGGSVTAANQVAAAAIVSTTTQGQFLSNITMGAGDFLNINVDANTAGQFAWVTVIEI